MNLILFLVILLGCCGYAALRGGAPERVAAALQVGAYIVTLALSRAIDGDSFAHVVLGTAMLDVALLVALVGLAWRAARFWPLWVAGWQLAAVIGHVAKTIEPGMAASGYAVQAQIWAYPMLVATAVGAWRHAVRVRRDGADPSWKTVAA